MLRAVSGGYNFRSGMLEHCAAHWQIDHTRARRQKTLQRWRLAGHSAVDVQYLRRQDPRKGPEVSCRTLRETGTNRGAETHREKRPVLRVIQATLKQSLIVVT